MDAQDISQQLWKNTHYSNVPVFHHSNDERRKLIFIKGE